VLAPAGGTPAWQPLDRDARRLRLAFGLGWPLAMAATPWWLGQGGLGLGCGFRALTGMSCPLCGGTHACAALVQGDWAAAWAANPGAVLLLVWLVLLGPGGGGRHAGPPPHGALAVVASGSAGGGGWRIAAALAAAPSGAGVAGCPAFFLILLSLFPSSVSGARMHRW